MLPLGVLCFFLVCHLLVGLVVVGGSVGGLPAPKSELSPGQQWGLVFTADVPSLLRWLHARAQRRHPDGGACAPGGVSGAHVPFTQDPGPAQTPSWSPSLPRPTGAPRGRPHSTGLGGRARRRPGSRSVPPGSPPFSDLLGDWGDSSLPPSWRPPWAARVLRATCVVVFWVEQLCCVPGAWGWSGRGPRGLLSVSALPRVHLLLRAGPPCSHQHRQDPWGQGWPRAGVGGSACGGQRHCLCHLTDWPPVPRPPPAV